MLYWIIVLAWSVIGTLIFWFILSVKWSKLDPLFVRMLDTFRVMNPIPGYPGYLDLKFTVLRHAIVFIISSTLIFYVKVKFVLSIVLFLNLIYAYSTISRYRFRKQHLRDTARRPNSEATLSFISIPVRDSFCTVVYSVLCVVFLYVLFAIRP